MSSIRQFVILAGGKGTRLGPLAALTPKPLMKIADDRVFLDYLVENAARQNFADILIIAGHLGSQIAERFDNVKIGGSDVSVLIEPEPRGTGGALDFAKSHLAGAFLATNGDTFFDINFRSIASALEADAQLDGVMALRRVDNVERYGAVIHDEAGRVTRFVEKGAASAGKSGVINGGIYALRRRTLSRLLETPASLEVDLFPKLAAEGKLRGIVFEKYFIDIGLPETLEAARQDFATALRPALFLDRDGVINHDTHYLYDYKDWRWIDGAIETIRMANDAGVAVVVVTNQAGVARGKFAESDVISLHAKVQAELATHGAFVDAFYYCPYHAEGIDENYQINDPLDRKPSANLLFRAAKQQRLDLKRSLFVGDQNSDRLAAERGSVPFLHYLDGNLREIITRSAHWGKILRQT